MIFITTLGVYLGLLMVGGAAPQVFAHSATTRNFEIADEIEITDRLDDKPDPDRLESDEPNLADQIRSSASAAVSGYLIHFIKKPAQPGFVSIYRTLFRHREYPELSVGFAHIARPRADSTLRQIISKIHFARSGLEPLFAGRA